MAGNIKRALAVENTHIPDTTRNAWFTWRYVVPEISKSNEVSTVVKEHHLYNLPSTNPNTRNMKNGKKASVFFSAFLSALASRTAIRVNVELFSPISSAPKIIC